MYNVTVNIFLVTLGIKLPTTALIPSLPRAGCPNGTFDCSDGRCRCFCENHCSWQKCTLNEKPDHCLVDQNTMWVWDPRNKYWVAQYKGMHCTILLNIIYYIANKIIRFTIIKIFAILRRFSNLGFGLLS